ncbi:unnamed protein product [Effrenium voratum]|nr:unnamed protein product [Effrenium voratum]
MARREAREMRRFARPGRGRHDLGGLCGHGAGTSRGRESSGEDLTARSTALTRPAWSANSADAKTASAQFCWRCGELIRQGRLPLTEADGKTERTLETAITVPPDTRLDWACLSNSSRAVEAEQKARARSAGCVLTLQLAKPSHDAVQS